KTEVLQGCFANQNFCSECGEKVGIIEGKPAVHNIKLVGYQSGLFDDNFAVKKKCGCVSCNDCECEDCNDCGTCTCTKCKRCYLGHLDGACSCNSRYKACKDINLDICSITHYHNLDDKECC